MKKVKILILLTIILSFIVVINKVNAENIELKIETKYIYDKKTNTVIGKMISNIPLKDTKSSWKLSEDGLTYTNENFKENGSYYTWVEDIYGNKAEVLIDINLIDDKAPEIKMEYKYNAETNTVTAIMHSNERLKDTKVSWNLSKDGLTYTNENFIENGSYYTEVEDIYGNKTKVLIDINLVDDKAPEIKIEYKYNTETNTVTAIMHSNERLKDTKVLWNLSKDGLTYTNENFIENGSYYTEVEDIYGNKTKVLIEITQIDDKAPEIKIEYKYNTETNIVIVIMHSNEELKDTKTSWSLNSDKTIYTSSEMTSNGAYYTWVEDRYGNKTKVLIEITQIDDKPPIINLEYEYNVADNTVIVTMNSNEILGDTKPTWKLSEDNLKYKKVFSEDQEYATPVEDRYGNQIWIKIKIKTKSFTYTNNKGPNVTVKYLYDSNENVTVYIISDQKLKDTKPTWKLSKDKMVYTKIFTNNDNYTTPIEDIEDNKVNVSILVNFFKNTLKGIDVSEYQYIIDWQKVKNSGIDFSIIRAGYRGWGTGRIVEDKFFDRNIKEATKVGMDIGIYFFTQATTIEEGREEARYTLSLLSRYNVPIRYPIAIDTERTPPGNGRGDKISKQLRTEIVKAFCQEIEKAGYKSMIYGNRNWLLNDLEIEKLSDYDVWLAEYNSSTNYKYPYTIWQYTSGGTVSGIGGRVDMNIGYKRY